MPATTETTERKLGSRDAKAVRMCPDNELRPPKMRFEDTFSAETVVMETFFPGR